MLDLALKIDIDTYHGLEQGVPRLLERLARGGVVASFYVAMGPDNSGKALRRVFTRKGFLAKMLRSNAVRLYGLRTALYGTLLPAPQIARSFPDLLRCIRADGHELGVHGYDHVRWHDHALGLGEAAVAAEVGRAVANFAEILGAPPVGFAAPGWQCGAATIAVLDRGPFLYHSCTRGTRPYRPRADGVVGRIPEIPTTAATLDELFGLGLDRDESVARLERSLVDGAPNVWTLHAEVEGGACFDLFDRLLQRLDGRVRYHRLADLAAGLDAPALEVCEVVQGTLPGRAGTVSCQGR